MRIRSMFAAAAGLVVLVGCDKEVKPTETVLQESAIIRYVNAIPDTSGLDFRFVDGSIEGSPQYSNVPFRNFTAYQRVRAGTRNIKVFTSPVPYGNNIAVATQQHIDTTFTFEPNARYTIISYGFARATSTPRHRLVIIRDELPTLTATQVGLRTIHAAPGVGSVDLYVRPSETAAGVVGATPTVANVAPLGITAYLNLLPRPVGTLLYRYDLTAPGSSTALTVNPSSGLPGQVGTAAINPLAGFQVGRSVITAILFGPSVTGSTAAPFAAAGLRFLPDRHLDVTEQ